MADHVSEYRRDLLQAIQITWLLILPTSLFTLFAYLTGWVLVPILSHLLVFQLAWAGALLVARHHILTVLDVQP